MAGQDEQAKAYAPSSVEPGGAAYGIPVEVTAVLGTAQLQVSQILKLGRGAVVELDRVVGEPIEIHANNQLIARGEVVVIEDRLGVQMTEIIKSTSG